MECLPRDPAWATGVALAPILFLFVSLAAERVVDKSTMIGEVFALWTFIGIAGQLMFGPLTVVLLIGAFALGRREFRVGRWFASVGCSAMVLLCTIITLGILGQAFGPDPRRDPSERSPLESLGGASLVGLPFLALGVANAYVVMRLRKRPAS